MRPPIIWRRTGAFLKGATENKVLVGTIELFAALSVIVTVAVMWAIYLGQREDSLALQRKQLAVEMLTLGHDENIVAAKSKVTRFIMSNSRQIHEASIAASKDKVPATNIDDASREAFVAMTEYYDEVLKCRESGECDSGMIDLWFRYDICGFTEFAQLTAFPALIDVYGAQFGDRLVRYKQSACPHQPV